MLLQILVYIFLPSFAQSLTNQICSPSSGGELIFRQTFVYDRNQSLFNPLRGFVPYCCDAPNRFPASLENFYIAMKELMNGPSSFTFNTSIEQRLQSAASRNRHSIVRVYVEFPGVTLNLTDGIPAYLVRGLNFTRYPNRKNIHVNLSLIISASDGVSPDYTNTTLIDAMVTLIQELARRYDGDPRIGFFQGNHSK